MAKAIGTLIGLMIIAAFVMGVYWLIWHLWCWVMPQIWAAGPPNLVRPGYWVFAACWFLITFLGRQVFGRSST